MEHPNSNISIYQVENMIYCQYTQSEGRGSPTEAHSYLQEASGAKQGDKKKHRGGKYNEESFTIRLAMHIWSMLEPDVNPYLTSQVICRSATVQRGKLSLARRFTDMNMYACMQHKCHGHLHPNPSGVHSEEELSCSDPPYGPSERVQALAGSPDRPQARQRRYHQVRDTFIDSQIPSRRRCACLGLFLRAPPRTLSYEHWFRGSCFLESTIHVGPMAPHCPLQ